MSAALKMAKARSLGPQGDPGLFGAIGKLVGRVGTKITGIGAAIGIPGMGFANQISKYVAGTGKMTARQYGTGVVNAGKILVNSGLARGSPPIPFGGGGFGGGGGGGMLDSYQKPDDFRHMKYNASSGEWERSHKRRRMNYANGRAITRAARRLKGAEKMFRKVFTIRHGKAPSHIHPKGKR